MTPFVRDADEAQVAYESLRGQALAGAGPGEAAMARFARLGMPGLLWAPEPTGLLVARVLGAARPPWCGDTDPRLDALAAGFALVVADSPCAPRTAEARS